MPMQDAAEKALARYIARLLQQHPGKNLCEPYMQDGICAKIEVSVENNCHICRRQVQP